MTRLAKKLNEKNLLSQEDFTWSQKMTKKDWKDCKKFFDQLYLQIHVKNQDINTLNKVITEWKKTSKECIDRLRDELQYSDNNIMLWKKRYEEVSNSLRTVKQASNILILICIVLLLVAVYLWILVS